MNEAKKKPFDALKMKDEIQSALHEKTKDLSPEQQVSYYKDVMEKGPFAALVAKMRAAAKDKQSKEQRAG